MKLFLTITLLLMYGVSDSAGVQNCCEKLSIPSKCYFLCGTSEESWISITRWTCTHSYGASVAKCKITSSIDYVKAFGDRFTNTLQKGFDQLSASLQSKLTDAAKFATATISELNGVGQDILASLSTLSEMTFSQFQGLTSRFTKFTTANLRNLFSRVKLDIIFQNIKDLANKAWDLSQINVIIESVYKKYGKNIATWTSAQISALGNLITGIPSTDLAKLGATAFDQSLTSLCKAKLKIYQKLSLITPASLAYGKISTWSSAKITKLCNLVEALTPEELLELSAKEVSGAVNKLKTLSFTEAQLDAILKKMKEQLGDIPSWTQSQLENIGEMAKGLKSSELAKIDKDKIKNMLTSLGNIKWDTAQARKLGLKLQEALGIPETWTSTNLNQAKTMLQGLVASELAKIKDTELASSLLNLKSTNWTLDQAQVILGKIKKQVGLRALTKNDILAIANTMDAFASSDVGKFTQATLFAVFPELIVVKTIGTPVLRQFIKVYKDQPGNNDISLLGGMAQALTRIELNKATVTDILASLEKLTGSDWDEAQVAELMIKVRTKLGNLNLTETADVDSPPWGFENLKKLGKVVLGFTKEELKVFPIRGIEDSLEVLGKQSGWKRGQVVSVMKRFREYLQMRNTSVEKLGEMDIEALGSLAQGFAVKELKSLPKSVLTVAVRKIGEQSGLPEDKLKSISYTAVKHFKDISGADVLDTKQIQSLGNLVAGLSQEALSKISKNAFLSEAYNIAKRPGMDKGKLQSLIDLGKKHYGQSDTGKWLTEQWQKLGPALKVMNIGDISKINKESFDGMIDYLGEMDGWSVEQAQALVLKAKEYWNERDVSKWSGAQLRRLGSLIRGLSVDEIKRIGASSFKDMIGSCAHFTDLKQDTLQALATRAKQVLASGDASKFTFTAIKSMGCAVTGLSAGDLAKLNLNIDVIAELGKHTGWNQQQLQAIATKVKTFMQNNLNNENLMSVGNLIKGYTSEDIKKLSKDAFSYAAGNLGKIDGLNVDQIKSLASKAKESYGSDVSKWSLPQVSEVGNMLSGLEASDLSKINTDAIDKISIKTLKALSKEQIKAFTPKQLQSMDSPQAFSLTANQKSQLSSAQLQALLSVEQSDPQDPNPWPSKGVSSGIRIEATSILQIVMLAVAFLFWQRA